MTHDITLIITLALIIIFSPFLAKLFKIPTTPIEIILGAVFGYAGLLHGSHLFEFVAEVGFLFLMFLAGMEINLRTFLRTDRRVMERIILYLVGLYALSALAVWYLELSRIFMVLLPLISVGLVAALNKEYGKSEWLALAMIAGGIGEVVSIAILTVSSAALQSGIGMGLFKTIGALILFIVIITLIFKLLQLFFWWFPEVATMLMPHEDNREQDVRLSIGILFLLVAIMLYLDLELAFAAFIAGMFIPTFFEHKRELPEKLESFGFGFLVPLFFIYIGTTFDLSALMMDGLISKALMVTFLMIAIRLIAAQIFTPAMGWRDALRIGLSHAMPLTLLIAITSLAYYNHSIDKLHYYALILASLFEVIIVMIAIKLLHIIRIPAEELHG
ncbi:MAG: cation:proton antiporter [Campylobacterales bacterium]|jgi:Kef-type K+ transport system membrane component KefB